MLAVDVDEPLADFAHLAHGDGRGVDPGARASLDVDRAPQEHRVALFKARVLKPASCARHDRKLRAHLGALAPLADYVGVAAGAEHELQRVDQNRLARARFARKAR